MRIANGAARIDVGSFVHRYETLLTLDRRTGSRPLGGTWFETHNPYTGEAWAEIASGSAADVDAAVQAAHRAFTEGPWSKFTATERGALLRRVGDLIARDARRLAEIEVRDNGKLLAEMLGQLHYIPSGSTTSAGWRTRSRGA